MAKPRIIIATPLFPPETGDAARWAKRRAAELVKEHETVVVAYGHLPESVSGVRIIEIDKRSALVVRFSRFLRTLWHEAHRAERIEACEVAAAIPAVLVGRLRNIPVRVRFRGSEAKERGREHGVKVRIIATLELIVRSFASEVTEEPGGNGIRHATTRALSPVIDGGSRTLEELGYALDERQPHLGGERRHFSADKSVLFGTRRRDGLRVVIKISATPSGIAELERERACRAALENMGFAYGTFYSPDEIYAGRHGAQLIVITRFVEQDKPFLERPLDEQYALALQGFEAQEGAHAVTEQHVRFARKNFELWTVHDYLARAREYRDEIARIRGEASPTVDEAVKRLMNAPDDIERYCGFLTHYDFSPQNIRVSGGRLYLLDHASLRFGNKHESWARFMNFMVLYNPALERMLDTHVRDERSTEEYRSLTLMRSFRLLELIAHHARISEKAEDALAELSRTRVAFWTHVLSHVLDGTTMPPEDIATYQNARDSLRSPEEKERQKGLH